jgi:hypothetical protein
LHVQIGWQKVFDFPYLDYDRADGALFGSPVSPNPAASEMPPPNLNMKRLPGRDTLYKREEREQKGEKRGDIDREEREEEKREGRERRKRR